MKTSNMFKTGGLVLGLIGLVVPGFLPIEGLNLAGQLTLGIFLMAGVFWITEPVPIYATSLLVILLQVLLLSDKGFLDFQNVSGYEAENYKTFYATLANPIIVLFLGGFALATAAVKYGLDRALTRLLLKPFGTRPASVCLGMMLTTALLSAFMSNTATTAMMMAIVTPLIFALPSKDPFRKGIALCVPVAANIGGVATPIGTPPNAIALAALKEQGITLSFSTWMLLAVPIVCIMLVISWRILLAIFPPTTSKLEIDFNEKFKPSRNAIFASALFSATVLLWVTEKLHGIPSSIIAFLPIALMPAFGILKVEDIRKYSWEVLWLVAGGISMGISLKTTGLAQWILSLIAWDTLGVISMILLFTLVAYALANIISNTVSATLLIPLAIGLSASGVGGKGFPFVGTILLIGVIVSFSMMLPISTPPNAIAMSTGRIKTADMAKVGAVIGVCALVLCSLALHFYWPLILNQ